MTYLSASEWCENNVSQSMFDTFEDWFEACKDEFDNGFDLFQNEEFISLLKDSWDKFSEDREDEVVERRDIEEEIQKRIEQEKKEKEKEKEKRIIADRFPEPPSKPPIPIPEKVTIEVEQPRVIPSGGQAPIVSQQRFTFKEPSKARAFIKRVFRI